MADDKLKRGAGFKAKALVCGVCDTTGFPCPGCPKREQLAPVAYDHGWGKVISANPELGRLQQASARAARNVATLNESHSAFPAWLAEYQRLGEQLAALYRRRHQEGVS